MLYDQAHNARLSSEVFAFATCSHANEQIAVNAVCAYLVTPEPAGFGDMTENHDD